MEPRPAGRTRCDRVLAAVSRELEARRSMLDEAVGDLESVTIIVRFDGQHRVRHTLIRTEAASDIPQVRREG